MSLVCYERGYLISIAYNLFSFLTLFLNQDLISKSGLVINSYTCKQLSERKFFFCQHIFKESMHSFDCIRYVLLSLNGFFNALPSLSYNRFGIRENVFSNTYSVDLHVTVCLGSECFIDVKLMEDTVIQPIVCDYRQPYKIPGTCLRPRITGLVIIRFDCLSFV